MSKHAAGELRRAITPRHVRHAQSGPELGVGTRGVRLHTAPAAAAGRTVSLPTEATRKLQENGK